MILKKITRKKEIQNHLQIGTVLMMFLSCAANVLSQTGEIKGYVIDSVSNEPIIGARILLEGLSKGSVSDVDGGYLIDQVSEGTYRLKVSSFSYKTTIVPAVMVKAGEIEEVKILLNLETTNLEEIEVVTKANRETESALLLDQKNAIISIQNIGAQELSRKGLSDAESAVSRISGISKQEGVKNVFIRGLEDRYNATLLNGLPIPSEDPEYKNIALEIFSADIIQSVGINKVFSAQNYGDVGGAIVQINSKEMTSNFNFNASFSSGFNSSALDSKFLKASGTNYFGVSKSNKPTMNQFDFSNKLDPSQVKLPLNHSYKINGGKRFDFKKSSLSLFGVTMYSNDFSATKEVIRNANTMGVVYQDYEGEKFTTKTSQIVLGNMKYDFGKSVSLAYNLVIFHTTNQYVSEFYGKNTEIFQDNDREMGYLRRQQMNENRLFTHQFLSKVQLIKKLSLLADFSYNTIIGLEPDRRENYLSLKNNDTYGLIGSNRQRRFFSNLKEDDYAVKAVFAYQLKDKFGNENSKIIIGYNGIYSNTDFKAIEYNLSGVPTSFTKENIRLDEVYNSENYQKNVFKMTEGNSNSYSVTKNIHAAFVEGVYQVSKAFTASAGFRMDYVSMDVFYNVTGSVGKNTIQKPFYLPSINLKYAINEKHSMRMGASKTYTLPQSKEISPYQYVNISFSSEGNAKILPSENYNADLKWDYYISRSEIVTVGMFYKYIMNPIGRVDKGNSAGLLTYDNISDHADIAGIEVELRKNLFNNSKEVASNKLSLGLNVSYIFSNLKLKLMNTPERYSKLMGSSPIIINTDITYSYTKNKNTLTTVIVLNYYSDKIFTNGTLGYENIIQKGIATLDYVFSYKMNRFSIKFKAANLLNPTFKLVRNYSDRNETITLNQFKKGINMSLEFSFNL